MESNLLKERSNARKFKKINHHIIRNILLALILIVLIIFLFKFNNNNENTKNINITIENRFDSNMLKNETQKEVFLNSNKIFENLFCGDKYQDIREFLVNYTVKSWYIDSFSKMKLSPKEINYKDVNSTVIIYIEKSYDSREFFLKTVFLKNNSNNEIIKRLEC